MQTWHRLAFVSRQLLGKQFVGCSQLQKKENFKYPTKILAALVQKEASSETHPHPTKTCDMDFGPTNQNLIIVVVAGGGGVVVVCIPFFYFWCIEYCGQIISRL